MLASHRALQYKNRIAAIVLQCKSKANTMQNANAYNYVRATASVTQLTDEQAEALFDRIAETIAQFEEEHKCECDSSIYIFNAADEAVY